MSPHDALQAWQDGTISEEAALRLSGAGDVLQMYEWCVSWDVEIKLPLTHEQADLVDAARGFANLDAGRGVDVADMIAKARAIVAAKRKGGPHGPPWLLS